VRGSATHRNKKAGSFDPAFFIENVIAGLDPAYVDGPLFCKDWI
jgi:hypothetical protein